MIKFIQLLVSGIAMGLIYGLIALGFVLIYKSSKIFNFAQGEMVMVGSYLTWSCMSFMTLIYLPVWLGLLVALIISGIAGYFLERFPLRPLIGQPILAIVMMTLAIAVFLRGFAVMCWAQYIGIKFPTIFAEKIFYISHVAISSVIVWFFLLIVTLLIILNIFFHYSRTGLHMRAAAESHQLSQSMGIRVTNAIAQSWAIAAVVSTIGGFLLGYVRGIELLW